MVFLTSRPSGPYLEVSRAIPLQLWFRGRGRIERDSAEGDLRVVSQVP